MVVLASQISLLEERRREAKGNKGVSEPPAERNGMCIWHSQGPYLTWLELKTVAPAATVASPARAAKISR